ncbi:rod shape-determining protein [Gorillibacterium sp. sgz5001074]|uniref:rod shape-determining protein n=1 Tax=Gorillibacterium sp. sgz5001074 TaxID=3446695 RepID=UPI003F67EA5A
MQWLKGWETKLGIDLGTSTTIIYQKGKGIVLSEPSVVAYNRESGHIEAAGEEARAMVGRTPGYLEVVFPLKDGVIANFDMTTVMLQHFVKKLEGRMSFLRTTSMFISVPCGITNVQKRAVEETVIRKGAKKAVAVEEPLAAAWGAGLPVLEPTGCIIVDIGGGTIQVAVLSLGGIVVSHSVNRGGMSIDREIVEHVKKTYNLAIGLRTAEDVKIRIGSAVAPEKDASMDIRGRDLLTGLPKTLSVNATELHMLLEDFITSTVEAVRTTLEQCPPELAGDIMDRGITLCGGGSQLSGLDRRLQAEIRVPVRIADRPQECVALGIGRMLGGQSSASVMGEAAESSSAGRILNPAGWYMGPGRDEDAEEEEEATITTVS